MESQEVEPDRPSGSGNDCAIEPEREVRWGSRLGVILAVAGSAVGLGNFLRFPGQAVAHGGGAFMVPYFIALVFLGIPVAWAEWTMARYAGNRGYHSSPGVLGVVGRGRVARYLGVLGVLIPLVIYMYYIIVEAWCLRYFAEYLFGGFGVDAAPGAQAEHARGFFHEVAGMESNGIVFNELIHPTVLCWIIASGLNLWWVTRGLSRGVEKFCRWAMPGMALCSLIVLFRVLTLGTPDPAFPERNVLAGLGFLWNPDFSQLLDFDTWLAATGQVFFSLSVGFGVIINYASYLRRDEDVVLSSLTAAATNEVFEVGFGGLITVTAAFVFLGAGGVMGGTFGLGFQALPMVFQQMGDGGRWIGLLWFFILFLAAVTSSLSMLQPVIAFLQEALGLPRSKAAPLTAVFAGVGSLWVLYFSQDLSALDTMDFWVGTFAIYLFATVQVICFGWRMGLPLGLASAAEGSQLSLPRGFAFVIKYISPCYLLIVLVGFATQSLPSYVRQLWNHAPAAATVGWLGVVLVLLLWITRLGEKRWARLGFDSDGRLADDTGSPPRGARP